jgi:glycosyltransferase involved in cell wall biosynthesis
VTEAVGPSGDSAPASPGAGKRILMLLENAPYTRDRRVRREAVALTEAGYRVTVIAPARRGEPASEVLEGVRVERFSAPRPGDSVLGYAREYGVAMSRIFARSLRVLARDGFDAVHAHNPPDTFFLIALLYKLFGKRFVYDHHDLAPELYYARFPGRGKRLVYRALVALERLSFRAADHVIATNESSAATARERGRVPSRRITVVRNGPSEAWLNGAVPDPALRSRGVTIIGYVGVIGVQDGLDYLLRALAHLLHDLGRRDFYAVLIGSGDALEDLRKLSAELGVDEHILFTGFVDDEKQLLRYLAATDICVVPDPSNDYNDRSTMVKLMEYMALGKPIVAFDLPEHRVSAQDAAEFAPPNDEREFARTIAELMDDPERRRTMGEAGRRRVSAELAWPYSVPKLLRAYDSVFHDG